MFADDNVTAIASAVTPWKRAWPGQRLLKMCESFQSAATGATAVITLAKVSRLFPSVRPPWPATGWVIGASDRLDGVGPTLLTVSCARPHTPTTVCGQRAAPLL